MNRFGKYLKVFLSIAMVVLQLVMPVSSIALANDTNDNGADIDLGLIDLDLDIDFGFAQDSALASSTTLQPAYAGYIPEMRFADDMLPYIDEDEVFLPIMPMSGTASAPGSGLVQLVLEPVGGNDPRYPGYVCLNFNPNGNGRCVTGGQNWITVPNARAAAFNAGTIYHRVFTTATGAEFVGINGRYGRDALFLGTSANGQRYRILIAGMVGYVNRVDTLAPRNITVNALRHNGVTQSTTFQVRANAQFVPFNNYPNNPANGGVGSVSHYVNRDGHLYRVLTSNVGTAFGANPFVQFLTGPAPAWMNEPELHGARFYSFDGVFFYANPRHIREDGSGAINAGNPFFNYFQYLSFRSHSTVTAAQLDSFLVNPNVNPRTGSRWHTLNTTTSVMRNQGQAFVDAQNRYGINAILMYAKAMHEGAGGTSAIARNNNNLFGLGAFDATPSQSANWFPSPAASINSLARGWLSRGYLWHNDWRNAGPHAGHKGSGMNVRYATDPYWGQKIAGWAFRIDSHRPAAERDINREQISVRQNTGGVAVQNANGGTLYTANRANFRFFPFLVTGTGTNNRLQVVTDTSIVNGAVARPDGCTITAQNTCDARTNARYNNNLFNRQTAIGYIQNSDVWLTGAATPAQQPLTPPPGNTNTGDINNNNNNNNNNQTTPGLSLPVGVAQPNRRVVPVVSRVININSGGVLNVRATPVNGNIIDTLQNNASVTVVGTNADGSWLLIRSNSYGWVSANFINVQTSNLQTYDPIQTPPGQNPSGTTNSGWQQAQTANQWYFYGANGQRQTGWVRSGAQWYFLNPQAGQPGHNTSLPVGRMLDGWLTLGNQRFFLNPLPGQPGNRAGRAHGAMFDGWVLINNQWYYFNPARGRAGHATNLERGVMREGWVSISNRWFFLNPRSGQPGHDASVPHGRMRDGWVRVGSNWFFLNPTSGQPGHTNALAHGVMRTGTIQVGGNRYNLDSQGRWRP